MMQRCVVTWCGLVASVALAVPSFAAVKPRSCGTERTRSGGIVFRVQAVKTACPTARSVAGRWYSVQSHVSSAPVVFDAQNRRWRCRITERATGTDPGYNPYTSVQCLRRDNVVRFKLRS